MEPKRRAAVQTALRCPRPALDVGLALGRLPAPVCCSSGPPALFPDCALLPSTGLGEHRDVPDGQGSGGVPGETRDCHLPGLVPRQQVTATQDEGVRLHLRGALGRGSAAPGTKAPALVAQNCLVLIQRVGLVGLGVLWWWSGLGQVPGNHP